MTTLNNKFLLESLEPFLDTTVFEESGLVLTYTDYPPNIFGYQLTVPDVLRTICYFKFKLKYNGIKYKVKTYSSSYVKERIDLDVSGYLPCGSSPRTVQVFGKEKNYTLTIVLEKV